MLEMGRRGFLASSLAASLTSWTAVASDKSSETHSGQGLRLGRFLFDVTPPPGHSCCGGWITPVQAVDDPLDAVGLILLGAGKPIVLCAVDWTGLSNAAHWEWRKALAEAAGTTADRVAVHCVHQHNAPLACLAAESFVGSQGDLPHIVDVPFYQQCLERGRNAVREAVRTASPITHVAAGQARVEKVASNRRVSRDADGRIKAMRGSACRDPQLIALPEGTIDPWLKTVAFYKGPKKLAVCHYYATHPMSYYGDGRVTSDFVGLARKQRQQEEPETLQLYFTGCAGNLSAGKYNDGSPAVRPILAARMIAGMRAAEQELRPEPLEQVGWRTLEILPAPRATWDAAALERTINERSNSIVARNRSAYILSWIRRLEQKIPLSLSSLHMNRTALLHLPGECFIEYQLRAQQSQTDRFVATAAYGDGGPWYIPTKEEYPHGGYEVSVAFAEPSIDDLLTEGITKLLA